LSKVNAIRKKALDLVRKQDWAGAVKEYKRLAELDTANPNVFNELGDLYLKTGNKSDAFESFAKAVDAYSRVSLHNNAVAVCKKVLRLIPSRPEILTKFGMVRKRQGILKEAEAHFLAYLKQLDGELTITSGELTTRMAEIVVEMSDSAVVLGKVSELLLTQNLSDPAIAALAALYKCHVRDGEEAQAAAVAGKIKDLGADEVLLKAQTEISGGGPLPTVEPTVAVDAQPVSPNPQTQSEPEPHETSDSGQPAPATASANDPFSYGEVEIAGQATGTATETMPAPETVSAEFEELPGAQAPADESSTGAETVEAEPESQEQTEQPVDETVQPETNTTPADEDAAEPEDSEPDPEEVPGEQPAPDVTAEVTPESDTEYDISSEEASQTDTQDEVPSWAREDTGKKEEVESLNVSAIIGGDDEDGGDGDDYRSHYDLGMAYLEMDLLAEAIREFQFASRSKQYQVKSLEMIGVCFLNQNQASLAIKQLKKGLSLIGENDSEALGLKYNLGLAYEMAGDRPNAKSAFEDVYVEDVTFRDIGEKIKEYME